MKRLSIMASAIFVTLPFALNAKSVETKPFDEVVVNVAANVRLIYGETYSIDVKSANPIAEKALRWKVESNKLKLSSLDEEEIQNLRITIYSPEAPVLKVGRDMQEVEKKSIAKQATRKDSASREK